MKIIEYKSPFKIIALPIIAVVVCVIIMLLGGLFIVGAYVLFGIIAVVLSIYVNIMWSRIVEDINYMCIGDREGTLLPYAPAMQIGALTLGIYAVYYLYRVQMKMYNNSDRYDARVTASGGKIVLWCVLSLVTLGIGFIVAEVILINSFNQFALAYNRAANAESNSGNDIKNNLRFKASKGSIKCVSGIQGETMVGAAVYIGAGESIAIGRDPAQSQLVLKDEAISRRHCMVRYNPDSNLYSVIDFSSNGTYNGKVRLQKGKENTLPAGTVLTLSKHTKIQLQ